MLYAEARPIIASGDLLAFANPRFVSRLIRTWTSGSWSHVGIAWRYQDRVFVLAAREGGGVGLDALSTQLPTCWLRTGARWDDGTERNALDRLGLPYSYADAARVALGGTVRNPYEVCSVYAATILRSAGIDLPAPSYTPSALVTALMERGAEMREIMADPVSIAA